VLHEPAVILAGVVILGVRELWLCLEELSLFDLGKLSDEEGRPL
jgi:hypothetical protein